ncbi:hypothetical protein Ancab_000658 [Ancistrocladus abbreviatus]
MARALLLYITLVALSALCNSDYAPDPSQLMGKALSCFNNDVVYRNCDEAYRLNQNGYINVPGPATDQFCYGPCLAETYLVLDCVDHTISNFEFYNKATVTDIRATLRSGCSHTDQRGNFNVQEFLQDERSSADSLLGTSYLFIVVFSYLLLFLTLMQAV